MVRATQEPLFDDTLPVPDLMGYIQPGPEQIDTNLTQGLSPYVQRAITLQAMQGAPPPDYWQLFQMGANPTDYTDPGNEPDRQLAYGAGELASSFAAPFIGTGTGAATGALVSAPTGPGAVGGAGVGALIGNRTADFTANAAFARRAEALRQQQAGEPENLDKQNAAAAIAGTIALLPLAKPIEKGAKLLPLALQAGANMARQGVAQGGASALTDLVTQGKVNWGKTGSALGVGAATQAGSDTVGQVGGKVFDAARKAGFFPDESQAPTGAGFGSTGYPGVPDKPIQLDNGGVGFAQDPYTATSLPMFDDFLKLYRKDYTTGTVRPAALKRDVNGSIDQMGSTEDSIDSVGLTTDAINAAESLVDEHGIQGALQKMQQYMQDAPLDQDKTDQIFARSVVEHLYKKAAIAQVSPTEISPTHTPVLNKATVDAQNQQARKQVVYDVSTPDGAMFSILNYHGPTDGQVADFTLAVRNYQGANPQRQPKELENIKDKIKKLLDNSGLERKRTGTSAQSKMLDRLKKELAKGTPIDENTIRDILNQGILAEAWTPEEQARMRQLFKQLAAAKEPKYALRAQAQIDQMIGSKKRFELTKFLGQNARAGWVMNPATQLANTTSQYLYATYQVASDITRVAFDMAATAARKAQGKVRPRQHYLLNTRNQKAKEMVAEKFPSMKGEFDNMWFDFKKGTDTRSVKDGTGYWNRGGLTDSKYLGVPYRFHNLVSGLIDRPIALAFANRRYGHRLQGLIEAGKLTPETAKDAYEQSILDAQTIIFQNESQTGRLAGSIRNNVAKLFTGWVPGGAGKLLEEGVMNSIDPYIKTNMNILEAVIRQSPLGFLRLARNLPGVPQEQRLTESQLIEALTEPLNGTLAMMLFWGMAENGAIKRQYDPDKPELADALRDSGDRDKSLNLSAAARGVLSGNPFSPDTAPMDGDTIVTIEQLSPLKQKLYLAQALAQAKQTGDAERTAVLTAAEVLSADTTKSGLISKLNRAFNFRDPETGDKNMLLGALVQFGQGFMGMLQVPGADALARGLDDTPPDLTTGNVLEQAINAWKVRVPILRNSIPDQLTPFGEIRKNDTPWFLPGHITQLPKPGDDPVKNELIRLGAINNAATIPKAFFRREPVKVNDIVQKNPDGSTQMKVIDDNQRRMASQKQGEFYLEQAALLHKFGIKKNGVNRPIYANLDDGQRTQVQAQILSDSRAAAYLAAGIREPKLITASGGQANMAPIVLLANPDAYFKLFVVNQYLPKALAKNVMERGTVAASQANQTLAEQYLPRINKRK